MDFPDYFQEYQYILRTILTYHEIWRDDDLDFDEWLSGFSWDEDERFTDDRIESRYVAAMFAALINAPEDRIARTKAQVDDIIEGKMRERLEAWYPDRDEHPVVRFSRESIIPGVPDEVIEEIKYGEES